MARKIKIRGNVCTVKNKKKVKLVCKKEGFNSKKCKALERKLKKC